MRFASPPAVELPNSASVCREASTHVCARRNIQERLERGFAFLGLLAFMVLFGLAMSAVAVVWTTMSQREREEELLFVGQEYRAAIARYRARNHTRADRLPRELSELLRDDTQVPPQRYLRKLYADPMTGKRDWGLVRAPSGGIIGVYSDSRSVPRRKSRFQEGLKDFAKAKQYRDWRFIVPDDAEIADTSAGVPAGGLVPPGAPGQPAVVPRVQGPASAPADLQSPVPVPTPREHARGEDPQALPSFTGPGMPPGADLQEPEPDAPSVDDGSSGTDADPGTSTDLGTEVDSGTLPR